MRVRVLVWREIPRLLYRHCHRCRSAVGDLKLAHDGLQSVLLAETGGTLQAAVRDRAGE